MEGDFPSSCDFGGKIKCFTPMSELLLNDSNNTREQQGGSIMTRREKITSADQQTTSIDTYTFTHKHTNTSIKPQHH